MAGVDVIVAALAAGGAAGSAAAVRDAYDAFKRRLAGAVRSGDARAALGRDSADPEFWLRAIGPELESTGAGDDEAVLRDAQRLLILAGDASAAAARDAPSEGQSIRVGTNYGAAGTFHGPVHVTGASPDPR